MNLRETDFDRFAYSLAVAYLMTQDTTARPITIRDRTCNYNGYLEAADRLGLVQTPFALHMTVLDAVRDEGERPEWRTVNNSARHAYDKAVAARISKWLQGDYS